jgi:ATP-dependent Clp protease ATP-binding subunit ClpA
LEDGRLTDSQKRLVPFENTIIIMTSNAAAEEIQQIIKAERETNMDLALINPIKELPSSVMNYKDDYAGAIEFLKSPITENFLVDIKGQLRGEFEGSFRKLQRYEFLQKEIKKTNNSTEKGNTQEKEVSSNLKSAVLERLTTMFLPEFLNRLDDIIVFQPLRPEELRKICDYMIKDVIERVKLKQITLSVEEKVKTKLTREGYNPSFGARPLRRLVTKYIEDSISEHILKNPITKKNRSLKIQLNEEDQILVKQED